jgi:glycosyltransferase involved in cell wall biosynthesis
MFSYNLPGGKIGFPIKKLLIGNMLRRVYRKIITEYAKPDLIHAHFPEIGYGCLSLVSRENIPFVYTEHFSRVLQPKVHPQLARAVIGIYEKCDLLITVSSSQQKQLAEQYCVKSTVISNTVDTQVFSVASFNEDRQGPFTFISVGALEKVKNMDLLIEAFKKVFFNEDPQYEITRKPILHIVGNGSQIGYLKQLINDNNLTEYTILHGLKNRHEIAQLFAQSDCFILVSKAETFGVVYIEAMAAGLPVIATRCGGPESYINDKNGKLVDVDDVDATAQAMVEMVRDRYQKYDKKEIREFTIDHFSPEKVSKSLIQEYESLLMKRSSQ